MQPQENPSRALQRLHGNSTQEFLLKNLYYLEYTEVNQHDMRGSW